MMKFTIVTCTYNAADTCEKTFESVLQQSYPNVEHLILDGCSKDDTLKLANAYQEQNTKSGATGDYILFLNAGDTFPNNQTLEAISRCTQQQNPLPAVLYGDTDIVDTNGKFIRHRRLSPPANLSWRSFKHGMLVCHQAFYARTDIAKQTPYNLQYRFSADVDWCIRIMKSAEKQHLPLLNLKQVVVNYLEGGLTDKNHRASLKERFRLMCSHYGMFTTIAMHVWFVFRSFLRK